MYILTNNPRAKEVCGGKYTVTLLEDRSYEGMLTEIRDRVHRGERLLTHPLYGSVKPGETPYRSVLMETRNGAVDPESLALIESAIASAGKFRDRQAGYDESIRADCREVDLSLLLGALGTGDP